MRRKPPVQKTINYDRCREYFTAPRLNNKHDETYPLHIIDQGKFFRQSIINYTFRYDAVLDAENLHASLVRLLETGDWRKLGGRLRLNVKRYEIYILKKAKA